MSIMNSSVSETMRRRCGSGSSGGLVLLVLLMLAWPWRVQADDSLRCGSRLVSTGMIEAEVEAVCGKPAFRDVEGYELPRNRGYDTDSEVWTYNFGPNRLLQQLRFRNGKLQSIHSGGYGFNPDTQGQCGPGDIVVGMTKYQLLHNCGEPVSKHAEELLAPTVPDGALYRRPDGVYAYRGGYQRQVYREQWVYNFGPNYFLRKVILENGKVTDVENGNRGFNPQ